MVLKVGNFKVKITVRKDGTIVIEIGPWERKGGFTPPAPKHANPLYLHEIGH
jgi:hypothetical protein